MNSNHQTSFVWQLPWHPAGGALSHWIVLAALLSGLLLTGCRAPYYSMMEAFGKQKRDLLRSALTKAAEENKVATEQFKDALTQLRELTGFSGGDLERRYNAFKAEYDDCVTKANTVKARVKNVDRIAKDLFAEWEKEIGQISTPSLRGSSQTKLQETRARYKTVHEALVRSEAALDPVLTQMKDYVLFLKHNLNAQAIGSLKSEALSIEKEINRLIADMTRSIKETESFLSTLSQ